MGDGVWRQVVEAVCAGLVFPDDVAGTEGAQTREELKAVLVQKRDRGDPLGRCGIGVSVRWEEL